ncbi:YebF family protein [Franconibacter daqui]|uniref:YebF family protein n=1 Tax=Franconibacter daqui TaxID=2047724 RepID=UPI002DBEF150|nr:YebF family protein [Franconibacter daqui]MEB5924619.1 protein YebF [Franconibacter daqui]
MKISKKLTFVIVFVLATYYIGNEIQTFVEGTGPSCDTLTYEQAMETISKDYLEYRMPRWDRDSEKLGTRSPVLSFDKENTQLSDVYFVPFKAEGTRGVISYFAIYDCKRGVVEYSVE